MTDAMKKIVLALFLIILTLTPKGIPAQGVPGDRITVSAREVISNVTPTLFGQNFGPMVNTSQEYVDLYRNLGVTLLRFPAGNYGDENDLYPNNLDDLATLSKHLNNAVVVIQTRSWIKGTPEKAVKVLKYCNLEHDYNFLYWEVGNEPDLYQKRAGSPKDMIFDVGWYNQHFRQVASALKAVDPRVKIVGTAISNPQSLVQWMLPFIRDNGDIIDVISWHWYGNGNELSEEQVLSNPKDVESQVRMIRGWWMDPQSNPKGYQRPVPPLLLSEYNVSWTTRVHRQLGTQVGALWNAEVVGRMADLGVEMGAHFALQGIDWQGTIGMLKDPRPVYWVYQFYSQWGTRQLKVDSTNEALLPAFASRREDGRLVLLVLNKDKNKERTVQVKLNGCRTSGEVVVSTLLADKPEPVTTSLKADKQFEYSFQPYSVTLMIFQPFPWQPWILGGVVLLILLGSFLTAMILVKHSRRGMR